MKIYNRRLPHFHSKAQPMFVTWCLAESPPQGRRFPSGSVTSGEAFVAMDRMLDEARTGPRFLAQPEVAEIVVGNIHELVPELHAYVVMPNHVHLLMTPDAPLDQILRQLKGRTARYANQALHRTGTFWQDESYDRLVRNRDEFARIVNYIENNPVRAGLVATPGVHRWSSARERD